MNRTLVTSFQVLVTAPEGRVVKAILCDEDKVVAMASAAFDAAVCASQTTHVGQVLTVTVHDPRVSWQGVSRTVAVTDGCAEVMP